MRVLCYVQQFSAKRAVLQSQHLYLSCASTGTAQQQLHSSLAWSISCAAASLCVPSGSVSACWAAIVTWLAASMIWLAAPGMLGTSADAKMLPMYSLLDSPAGALLLWCTTLWLGAVPARNAGRGVKLPAAPMSLANLCNCAKVMCVIACGSSTDGRAVAAVPVAAAFAF